MTTMKFYRDNRLDQKFEADPADVARQFCEAVRAGYDISRCRASAEFAFRWWLSDPEGFHVAWEQENDNTLMDDGLVTHFQAVPGDRELIWDKLTEGLR